MNQHTSLPKSSSFLSKTAGNLQDRRLRSTIRPKKPTTAIPRPTAVRPAPPGSAELKPATSRPITPQLSPMRLHTPIVDNVMLDEKAAPSLQLSRAGARAPTPSQQSAVDIQPMKRSRKSSGAAESHSPLIFSMEKEPSLPMRSRENSVGSMLHQNALSTIAKPKPNAELEKKIEARRTEAIKTWRTEVSAMLPKDGLDDTRATSPSRIPVYCGKPKKGRPRLTLLIPKDQKILISTLSSATDSTTNSSSTFKQSLPTAVDTIPREMSTLETPLPSPAKGSMEKLHGLKRRLAISTGMPEEVLFASLKHFDCSVLPDYLLKELKVEEINERIRILDLEIRHSKANGGSPLEWETLGTWIDFLVEEIRTFESGTRKPDYCSIQQFLSWTYRVDTAARYSLNPDAEHVRPQPDEFLNLETVGKELMRESLGGWETKMVRYWGRVFAHPDIGIVSHTDAIITHYLGTVCSQLKAQLRVRRMWYLCLDHYMYWKEAVSHWAIAQKMMNLMLVFHDLWGEHHEAMSESERETYEELAGKIHLFAFKFVLPWDGDDTASSWDGTGNECTYCLSKSALSVVEVPPHVDSIWSWFLMFSLVLGYGKYHTVLLRMLTQGRNVEYVNQIFNNGYHKRIYDMMLGRGRIMNTLEAIMTIDHANCGA